MLRAVRTHAVMTYRIFLYAFMMYRSIQTDAQGAVTDKDGRSSIRHEPFVLRNSVLENKQH